MAETIPGGKYISADGYWQNADGKWIDEAGNLVDEPIKANEKKAKKAGQEPNPPITPPDA